MDQLAEIRKKIPATVTLIAVSKTQSADAIEALYRQGQRDFGENYVQELLEKSAELQKRGCADIRWHFIGHLQSNKVKMCLPVTYAIHSIDSIKLAKEISKRASAKIACFLNVNIDCEETKSGFAPTETAEAAAEISKLPNIDLRGLMCIPAPRESAGASKPAFAALRELENTCRPSTHGELSMGMSDDFEIAIAEGATFIRIGTRLFGSRNQ
jgi:pyridoxal phosphate enzyme (YggS family)